jgi:acyl carrier protein
MTEDDVLAQLKPLIEEVTGVTADEIHSESTLMMDLGAESLDLLDLSFLIEEAFDIRLEADEFSRQAKQRVPGLVYEKDGYLTDEALVELRRALPEIEPRRLAGPLRRTDLPGILTVGVFFHLIQRKLAEKSEANVHA